MEKQQLMSNFSLRKFFKHTSVISGANLGTWKTENLCSDFNNRLKSLVPMILFFSPLTGIAPCALFLFTFLRTVIHLLLIDCELVDAVPISLFSIILLSAFIEWVILFFTLSLSLASAFFCFDLFFYFFIIFFIIIFSRREFSFQNFNSSLSDAKISCTTVILFSIFF